MRKFCWQRWSLVFLLMTRLVIGELGHAMPVTTMGALDHAMSHASSVPVSEPAACPEHEGPGHEGSAHAPTAAHHAADFAGDPSSDQQPSNQQDCCATGDCECPCLHVPCAALDALVLNPIAPALLGTPHGTDGLVSQRPSGLFRPPA